MNTTRTTRLALVAIALSPLFGLTACVSGSVGSPTDMCAVVLGDGQNGHDAKVHEVFFPGQEAKRSQTSEVVKYLACNARNLRLVDGTGDVDANGNKLAPVAAYSSDKIQVNVSVRMDWTLNENKETLTQVFYPLCGKYNCASDNVDTRTANFATTEGWSKGFLGENAVPAFQKAVRDVTAGYTYAQLTDPKFQNSTLNTTISAAFMQYMRATTGSTRDIMCSSGETSGWTDPLNPGTGSFNCGPVRISTDQIVPTDPKILQQQEALTKAAQDKAVNDAELQAAKAKYGDKAGEVLGQIDIVKAACENNKNCTVVVNTSNNLVAVP